MNLYKASQNVLYQLSQVIDQIDKDDFSRPLLTLNNSTIGQHVRHTLEFFLCMIKGLDSGVVNYDNRERDIEIETDPDVAKSKIDFVLDYLKPISENKELLLEGSFSLEEKDSDFKINSNFERELAYNIEHAVHHMAIIKIGVIETNPAMEIPANFGVAVSTVRHNN